MAKSSRGQLAAKLVLLSFSVLVCFFFAEVAMRLILNPVNFLRPVLVDDARMGHKVKSGTGGHDAWGFRNETVPERVDLVAIGDSHTYGVSAMAFNSWPAWLSRTTDRSVYNMALGGYGPIQYEALLRERALGLKPATVVLGVYLGNDIFDAYRVVYGLDAWKDKRSPELSSLVSPYKSIERPLHATLPSRIRTFIGQHSIVYRLTVSSFGHWLGLLELRVRKLSPGVTVLEDGDFRTAFTPVRRLKSLDFETPEVREGWRLMLESFERIVELCEQDGIRLVVVGVPTKELVFADRLAGRTDLNNAEVIAQLLVREARVWKDVQAFFEAREIPFVDPLPALREAALHEPIYPSNEGGHTVSAGYRVIAETIASAVGSDFGRSGSQAVSSR